MEICNSEKYSTNTRNIIFAANNLYIASSLLEDTHYDISNSILKLAKYLMSEISEDEKNSIDSAIKNIESVKL